MKSGNLPRPFKNSYRARLMVGFMFISVLPTLVVGLLSYQVSVRALEEEARAAAQQSLQQTSSNISEKLNSIATASELVFSSGNLQRMLRISPSRDAYTQVMDAKTVYDFFASITKSNAYVYRIRVFTKASLIYADDKVHFYPFSQLGEMNIPDLNRASDFIKLNWTSTYSLRNNSYTDSAESVVSAYRMLLCEDYSGQVNNIVFVDMRVNTLLQEIAHAQEKYPERSVTICDAMGRVICSTNKDYVWGKQGDIVVGQSGASLKTDDNTMILSQKIEPTGWHLMVTIPYSYIRNSSLSIRSMTLWATLVMLMVSVALSGLFSKSYSRKINGLIASVEKYVQGFCQDNQGVEKPAKENPDDIEALTITIQWMQQQLNHMVFDVYETRMVANQANLRALQEQIKPHFLYNILGSIKGSMDVGNVQRASDLIVALSRFFQLSLSNGEETISLADELAIIQKYTYLQNLLYPDVFDCQIEMNNDVSAFHIVRFTLQPLVENAIKHAFHPDRAKGLIHISCRSNENTILISVRDNGIGMSEEKVDQLNDSLRSGIRMNEQGYGLLNVNARLKLRYGTPYGLTVSSVPGAGSCIQITIPLDF